jgi:putative SOS response-associated peptidase YedK
MERSERRQTPFFIILPDEKPFAFAGLWERWRDKDKQEDSYRSFTIITREASKCLKDIHDRMPAILPPDSFDAWLDHDNHDTKTLENILAEKTVTDSGSGLYPSRLILFK